MKRVLVIGGTFNPVHFGHLALASVARDRLGIDRVDWVPCHTPHHRPAAEVLPFSLRCTLIEDAIADCEGMAVNPIEAELPTPSLTWRTVAALCDARRDVAHSFALGQREFLHLHKWVNGREIARQVDIVVIRRGAFEPDAFAARLQAAWPQARAVAPPAGSPAAWELLPGRRAVLLDLPPVDVSATMVRAAWCSGKDVAGMVPDAVIRRLEARRAEVDSTWARAQGTAFSRNAV